MIAQRTLPLLLLGLTSAMLLPGQDYKADLDAAVQETKVKLKMTESDNFVFYSAFSSSQTKPSIKATEKAFTVWKEITGIDSWRDVFGRRKAYVFMAKNKAQYRKLLKWYEKKGWCFPGHADAVVRANYAPNGFPRAAFFMHTKPLTVKQLPRVAAHEVGHLMVMRYKADPGWSPPWLEESMGVYMEARVFKRTFCYCFGGAYADAAGSKESLSDIEWSKWKAQVTKQVRKRSDKEMKAIMRLRFNQLGAPEVGKGWSVIDFLVQKDKEAFTRFMRGFRRNWPRSGKQGPEFTPKKFEAQDKAMKDAYGWTIEEMDREWRSWVKKGMKKFKK